MTCVTGTAIEPVPLTELELTGPEPPELAGGTQRVWCVSLPILVREASRAATQPRKLHYVVGGRRDGGGGGVRGPGWGGNEETTAERALAEPAGDKRTPMAAGEVIKVRGRGASLWATSWLTLGSAAAAAAPWDVTG